MPPRLETLETQQDKAKALAQTLTYELNRLQAKFKYDPEIRARVSFWLANEVKGAESEEKNEEKKVEEKPLSQEEKEDKILNQAKNDVEAHKNLRWYQYLWYWIIGRLSDLGLERGYIAYRALESTQKNLLALSTQDFLNQRNLLNNLTNPPNPESQTTTLDLWPKFLVSLIHKLYALLTAIVPPQSNEQAVVADESVQATAVQLDLNPFGRQAILLLEEAPPATRPETAALKQPLDTQEGKRAESASEAKDEQVATPVQAVSRSNPDSRDLEQSLDSEGESPQEVEFHLGEAQPPPESNPEEFPLIAKEIKTSAQDLSTVVKNAVIEEHKRNELRALCKLVGVDYKQATRKALKAGYQQVMLLLHPDKPFLNASYDEISHPEKEAKIQVVQQKQQKGFKQARNYEYDKGTVYDGRAIMEYLSNLKVGEDEVLNLGSEEDIRVWFAGFQGICWRFETVDEFIFEVNILKSELLGAELKQLRERFNGLEQKRIDFGEEMEEEIEKLKRDREEADRTQKARFAEADRKLDARLAETEKKIEDFLQQTNGGKRKKAELKHLSTTHHAQQGPMTHSSAESNHPPIAEDSLSLFAPEEDSSSKLKASSPQAKKAEQELTEAESASEAKDEQVATPVQAVSPSNPDNSDLEQSLDSDGESPQEVEFHLEEVQPPPKSKPEEFPLIVKEVKTPAQDLSTVVKNAVVEEHKRNELRALCKLVGVDYKQATRKALRAGFQQVMLMLHPDKSFLNADYKKISYPGKEDQLKALQELQESCFKQARTYQYDKGTVYDAQAIIGYLSKLEVEEDEVLNLGSDADVKTWLAGVQGFYWRFDAVDGFVIEVESFKLELLSAQVKQLKEEFARDHKERIYKIAALGKEREEEIAELKQGREQDRKENLRVRKEILPKLEERLIKLAHSVDFSLGKGKEIIPGLKQSVVHLHQENPSISHSSAVPKHPLMAEASSHPSAAPHLPRKDAGVTARELGTSIAKSGILVNSQITGVVQPDSELQVAFENTLRI